MEPNICEQCDLMGWYEFPEVEIIFYFLRVVLQFCHLFCLMS